MVLTSVLKTCTFLRCPCSITPSTSHQLITGSFNKLIEVCWSRENAELSRGFSLQSGEWKPQTFEWIRMEGKDKYLILIFMFFCFVGDAFQSIKDRIQAIRSQEETPRQLRHLPGRRTHSPPFTFPHWETFLWAEEVSWFSVLAKELNFYSECLAQCAQTVTVNVKRYWHPLMMTISSLTLDMASFSEAGKNQSRQSV